MEFHEIVYSIGIVIGIVLAIIFINVALIWAIHGQNASFFSFCFAIVNICEFITIANDWWTGHDLGFLQKMFLVTWPVWQWGETLHGEGGHIIAKIRGNRVITKEK